MNPEFELGRNFHTMRLSPSFIILCLLVRRLSCRQTNKHTNRQTLLKTSNVLRYAMTLGKHDQPSLTIHNVTRPLSKLDWRSTHSLLQTEQNSIFYATKTLAGPRGREHGPQTTDEFFFVLQKDCRTN